MGGEGDRREQQAREEYEGQSSADTAVRRRRRSANRARTPGARPSRGRGTRSGRPARKAGDSGMTPPGIFGRPRHPVHECRDVLAAGVAVDLSVLVPLEKGVIVLDQLGRAGGRPAEEQRSQDTGQRDRHDRERAPPPAPEHQPGDEEDGRDLDGCRRHDGGAACPSSPRRYARIPNSTRVRITPFIWAWWKLSRKN